jgi:hypothetical protein
VTESNAIARYIGRKHGLDGKTEEEKVHVDMLENLTYNLHIEFAKICYSPDYVIRLFFPPKNPILIFGFNFLLIFSYSRKFLK